MQKYYNDITIIVVTYKSNKNVINFIKKIPKFLKVIIVDNSYDFSLKKFNKKNIKIYFHKNNGFGTSLNYAASKIKTNYFFQISPDLEFNFKQLSKFYEVAKKLKNKFSALGPRFLNVNEKGHKQSDKQNLIGNVDAIHGSAMFIYKKNFNKIGKIDEKIFLYFEENDYCYRGKKLGLFAYQVNKTFIKKKGQTVKFNNKKNERQLENLLSWHFIWSKYYFYQKKFGRFATLIIFSPIIIRTIFKYFYTLLIKNEKKMEKYQYRLRGMIASILGRKSFLRL